MSTINSLKPKLDEAKEAERANMFPRKGLTISDLSETKERFFQNESKEIVVLVNKALLTKKELKVMAKKLGIKTSGSKAVILERLQGT